MPAAQLYKTMNIVICPGLLLCAACTSITNDNALLFTLNVKSNALSFVENCTEMCCTGSSYIMTDHKATLAAEGNGLH